MDDTREPEEPTRSDLRLVQGALRNDWPIPEPVRREILQAAVNLITPAEGETPAPARTRLAAMKVLVSMAKLNLGQAAVDLAREKAEGRARVERSLADAVAEAEALAEGRIREREQGDGGGGGRVA